MTSSIRKGLLLKRRKGVSDVCREFSIPITASEIIFDCLLEYTYWSNCRETGCFCREAEYVA